MMMHTQKTNTYSGQARTYQTVMSKKNMINDDFDDDDDYRFISDGNF